MGIKKDPSLKSFTNMGPVGWALGCLLLWIIVFPIYLIERRKHTGLPESKGMPLSSLGGIVAAAVLIGMIINGCD